MWFSGLTLAWLQKAASTLKDAWKIKVIAGVRRVHNLSEILLSGAPALLGCDLFSKLMTPSSVTVIGSSLAQFFDTGYQEGVHHLPL